MFGRHVFIAAACIRLKITAVYTNDRAVWMQQMALLALQLMRLCCMSELSISDKLLNVFDESIRIGDFQ